DIVLRHVSVVRLDHACGSVAEVLRHDHQRHPGHDREACPGVAQGVKIERGADPGAFTRFAHPQILVALPPRHAVMGKQERITGASGAPLFKQGGALVSEDNVPHPAGLALPERDPTATRVEILDREAAKLAVSASGSESGLYEPPEVVIGATIDQALALGDREITEPRSVNALERLNPPPCRIAGGATVPKSEVEGSLQGGQHPVGGALSPP